MLDTDVAAVERIEQQALSPWAVPALLEELDYARGICLVAEAVSDASSQVIGWCCCRYLVPEAELLKISVSGKHRGFGVATSLLKRLEQLLAERSVETLFLEVRSQNQSALNFYIKSGFLQVGSRVDYYSNPKDTAFLFQKTL